MTKSSHQSVALSQRSLPWQATVSILWLATAEGLRAASLQGAVAAAFAVLTLAVVPAFILVRSGGSVRILRAPVLALLIFMCWTLTVSVVTGFSREGLQNLSIYGAFVAIVLLNSAVVREYSSLDLLTRVRLFCMIGTLPTVLIGFLAGSMEQRFIGTGALPAIAAVGLIAAVVLPRNRSNYLFMLFFVGVIVLSLSRAYIVFAALALAVPVIRQISTPLTLRFALRLALMGVAAFMAMTQYPPLRDRFLINDGVSVGGLDIGTSGRDALWEVMIYHYTAGDSLVGSGAGASEVLITNTFGYITQPHNDYLRFALDFGSIGLTLWVVAMALLVAATIRAVRRTNSLDEIRLHIAALLSLTLILASSFLDNVVIYVFLMVPLAAIIGSSLSKGRRQIKPSRVS